jgi:hypothetical protein
MLASFLAGLLLLSPAASMENTVRAEPVEDPDDEVVCRRRQVASDNFGGRPRTMRVCKTREEWRNERPAPMRR